MSTARNLADAFALTHGFGAYGPRRTSDVVRACSTMGCTVESVPLGTECGRTFPDASGWRIQIGLGRSYRRQRFTLAHEVGHFLVQYHRLALPCEEEMFCNDFAAELLMPRAPLLRTVRGHDRDIGTASRVSDLFNVSLSSSVVRLNTAAGWSSAVLTFWKDDDWVLYSTLCAPRGVRSSIRSGDAIRTVLSGLATDVPTRTRLPLKLGAVALTVPSTMIRSGHFVTALIDRTDLRLAHAR